VPRRLITLRLRAAGLPIQQQPRQAGRVGELRRRAEAAIAVIKAQAQALPADAQRAGIEQRFCAAGGSAARERRGQLRGSAAQLLEMVVVVVGDLSQQIAKGRQAEARLAREVGAAEERPLVVVHQEHGQRPAAGAARQQLLALLVDAIEIGPLLAIDLDVDVERIHKLRGRRVLERFVRHDVAPMTGGIADRQQDRLVLAARAFERLAAPRIPVHGIVRVLAQIGARLMFELIHRCRPDFQ
jgi:hypothetical protein